MRLLVLDQFSSFGGAQLCLRDVLMEVHRRGWEAEVLAPGDGPLLDCARAHGFAALSLPMREYSTSGAAAADLLRFSPAIIQCACAIKQASERLRPHLVYVNGPRLLPAAILAHAPVVFHAHSVVTSRHAGVLAGWALRRARAMALACSEFAAAPVRAAIGTDSVRVIHNGVADCGFLGRPQSGHEVHVGLLGRLAPEKGHLDFLEAAKVLSSGSRLRLSITGASLFSDRGYERTIRAQAAKAGVEVRGWTNDIAAVLHELDILAVPSAVQEASTRVIMEAFSAGTCVVGYPSGGIPELIRHARTGVLTERQDPGALARAIQALAGDPAAMARMAANGRAEWEARFTVERFQREVCDRLEEAARWPTRAANAGRSRSGAPRFWRDAAPAWQERPSPLCAASGASASPVKAHARRQYTD